MTIIENDSVLSLPADGRSNVLKNTAVLWISTAAATWLVKSRSALLTKVSYTSALTYNQK